MRRENKFLSILIVFALIAVPAYASVLIKVNGATQKAVNDINFTGPETLTVTGDVLTLPVVDSSLIAAGLANGEATSLTTADKNVDAGYAYYRKVLTSNTGYTTGTISDGVKGQKMTIHAIGGSGSWALTPTTSASLSTITFDAVGEVCGLIWLNDTAGWTLDGYTNATVSLKL